MAGIRPPAQAVERTFQITEQIGEVTLGGVSSTAFPTLRLTVKPMRTSRSLPFVHAAVGSSSAGGRRLACRMNPGMTDLLRAALTAKN
jgi:hypothetical protein